MQGGTVKRLLIVLLALLIVPALVFPLAAGTIKKMSGEATTEKIDAKSTRLPASNEAKDRAALEKQKKQQKNASEAQMKDANSTEGNTSSTEKKKQMRTKASTQGQPTTGLPKD